MIPSADDMAALLVTLRLAAITTMLLLVISIPLACLLSRTAWRFKFIAEAIIALPIILPPTVLGFYLLLLLGPAGPIGRLTDYYGWSSLPFSFTGLVVGSIVYSFPFVFQPLYASFCSIGRQPTEAAATLRASPVDVFFTVLLPLARPGLISAAVLGFAHTIGEFGVVLMIGGNIPGRTRVLSIAIYEHVEMLEYHNAHLLSAALLLFSFLLLVIVYRFNHNRFPVQS